MLTAIRKLCTFSIMPFYAVRVGRQPGIYDTWNECKEQVTGYPKAAYKKFDSKHDAEEFVGGGASSGCKPTSSSSSKALGVKNNSLSKAKDEVKKQPLKIKEITHADTLKHQFIKRENLPTSPVVYTDGCCFKNGYSGAAGGIGVYWAPFHPKNVSEPLFIENPTNQKAELAAAARALEIAIEMGLTSIELRTDSIYTIKSMTEWIQRWEENGWRRADSGSVQNKELLKRLAELCKKISITWVHVAGHEGIYGNEEADRLAREGAMIRNA